MSHKRGSRGAGARTPGISLSGGCGNDAEGSGSPDAWVPLEGSGVGTDGAQGAFAPGPYPALSPPPGVPRSGIQQLEGSNPVWEGTSFTLHCANLRWVPMATYLWSHAGEWLQETGQDLHIFNASADDGGIYTCSIWVSGPSWGFLVSSASKSIMVHCECWDPPTLVVPQVRAAPADPDSPQSLLGV